MKITKFQLNYLYYLIIMVGVIGMFWQMKIENWWLMIPIGLFVWIVIEK